MPLIKGFKATNIWKAFLLNSLLSSIIIVLAIVIKGRLDNYTDKKGKTVTRTSNFKSISITFGITFVVSFMSYTIMYFLFGFGGAMMIND